MSRGVVIAALASLSLAGLAACSGSSGVHAQTSIPRTPPSTATSDSPATRTPSPRWTPPDYGDALPAVNAYLTFNALVDRAFRDPARISSSTFDKYLQGQAEELFDSELAQEKAQGKAYRGGNPIPHVRVLENHLTGAALPWAVLRDCQTNDPRNPSVEYYVATGKPVSANPADLKPYAATIKIFDIKGQWTITSFTVDSSKACTP